MMPRIIFSVIALLVALAAPAAAVDRSLAYSVEHPVYGTIGSYAEDFRDQPGGMRVDSRLRVAVKVLGITMYREETDRTETWAGERLQTVHNVTNRNGRRIEVRGEATPDSFVITTGEGAKNAPRDILPAEAWVLKTVGNAIVFAPRSGRIESVVIAGGDPETLTVQGRAVAVRHFRVHTQTQPDKWEVWLDTAGVPVKFRSMEDDDKIDFLLTSSANQAAMGR